MKNLLCALIVTCASVTAHAAEDIGLKGKEAFGQATTPTYEQGKPILLVQSTGGSGDYPGHEVDEKQKAIIKGSISLCGYNAHLAKYRNAKLLKKQWLGTSLNCYSNTPIVEASITSNASQHWPTLQPWQLPDYFPATLFTGKKQGDTVSFNYTPKNAAPVIICLKLAQSLGQFEEVLNDQINAGMAYEQDRQAKLQAAKQVVAELEKWDNVELGLEDNSRT